MTNTQATPKTLLEAIQNGLDSGSGELIVDDIRDHVIDYLAQKFGAVMLKADDGQELERLCELYLKCTGKQI